MKDKFTWSLAVVDLIPVLLFATTLTMIASAFYSKLFWAGGILCILAGLGKVTWKIIRAVNGKDIAILNYQFKKLMPAGFIVILVSIAERRNTIVWSEITSSISSFPAVVFFVLALVAVLVLLYMAKNLDQAKAKTNWIEELVNIAMQVFLLLGVASALYL